MTENMSIPDEKSSLHFQESARTEGSPIESGSMTVEEHVSAFTFAHDYSDEPRLRDMPFTLVNFPRILLLAFIRFYQVTFSRSLPANTCRFYPSCSHYGYQAIYKYGVFKGSLMAGWRILRCNPFNRGGYDPVS